MYFIQISKASKRNYLVKAAWFVPVFIFNRILICVNLPKSLRVYKLIL